MPTKKRYEHKITLGKDIDGNLFHHKLLIKEKRHGKTMPLILLRS